MTNENVTGPADNGPGHPGPFAEKDAHVVLEMPGRFYCACGYGYDGPKRTRKGLQTHVMRSNSIDAGERARRKATTPGRIGE